MDIVKDKQRIDKLLRLACDRRAAFKEEAISAGKKALELIARHSLHDYYADDIKLFLDIEADHLRKAASYRTTLREELDKVHANIPAEDRSPWSKPEPPERVKKRAEWGSKQGRVTMAQQVRVIIAYAKKHGYTRQGTAYLVERQLGLSLRDARAYIWYNWDKV